MLAESSKLSLQTSCFPADVRQSLNTTSRAKAQPIRRRLLSRPSSLLNSLPGRPRPLAVQSEGRPCRRQIIVAAQPCSKLGLLELHALQILDDGLNVVRAEHKDRHVGVARYNPFGKGLFELLDGIFARQGPKSRCLRMRAITLFDWTTSL